MSMFSYPNIIHMTHSITLPCNDKLFMASHLWMGRTIHQPKLINTRYVVPLGNREMEHFTCNKVRRPLRNREKETLCMLTTKSVVHPRPYGARELRSKATISVWHYLDRALSAGPRRCGPCPCWCCLPSSDTLLPHCCLIDQANILLGTILSQTKRTKALMT